MAIDRSLDSDDATLGQEFAKQPGFARTYRKRKQRRASFDESPPMIAPCIDPLTAILKARILGEGIDRAEGSRLDKRPLEARRVLIHEHELAREIQLRNLRRVRVAKVDDLRRDSFRRCCPAPHSKRRRNSLIIGQCSDVLGHGWLDNL